MATRLKIKSPLHKSRIKRLDSHKVCAEEIHLRELLAVRAHLWFGTPEEALELPEALYDSTDAMTYAFRRDIELLMKYFTGR